MSNINWSAYIEVQIPVEGAEPNYVTLNLKDDVAHLIQVGDKLLITRSVLDISNSGKGIIKESSLDHYHAHQEKKYPFDSSGRCFIQIVERIFLGNIIELHGKIVAKDGEFYQ